MSEQIRVLIVDDEERFRKTLTKLLISKGFLAHSVEKGDDALEELSKNPYDVVLLDVKMPGIGGVETLKQMKEIKCQAEVIILSGHASVDTAVNTMNLGAYDYLLKPCDIDELIAKISYAYERKIEKSKHS